MNLLLIAEIAECASLPAFGPEFEKHMEEKRHPGVHAASETAWNLLEAALRETGIAELPQVHFEETGKPVFADSSLHFSLSHSGKLACALLSDAPCAVDVEIIKQDVSTKLFDRCLNEQEKALGCDFFETWTKKECMGKLSGKGLPARPSEMDSLNPEFDACFYVRRMTDSDGQDYVLTALCTNKDKLQIKENRPEKI